MGRLLIAAGAAVACGAMVLTVRAAPVPVGDWQMLYEGDKTPDAGDSVYLTRQSTVDPVAKFTAVASNGTSSSDGDIYTFNSINTNKALAFSLASGQSPDFAPNSATGYTFETRARLLDLDATGPAAAVEFDFDEGTTGVDKFWKLVLYQDRNTGNYQALFAGLTPDGAPGSQVIVDIDNTSFHTYRVTVQGATGTLYVDGVNRGTMTDFSAIGTNALRFGDFTNEADGEAAVDYIRMNDTGAIPVPEPMSLSVLGLGGLLLMRRRK